MRWSLVDCLELPAAFPDPGQHLSQLLVGDVEVALCRLDVGVSEHQLDDPDVDAVSQEATGAFVPQVVPMQVDPQRLSVARVRGHRGGAGSRVETEQVGVTRRPHGVNRANANAARSKGLRADVSGLEDDRFRNRGLL